MGSRVLCFLELMFSSGKRENTPTSELMTEQGKGCSCGQAPEAGRPGPLECAAPTGEGRAGPRSSRGRLARAGVGAPRELGRAQQARCNSELKGRLAECRGPWGWKLKE